MSNAITKLGLSIAIAAALAATVVSDNAPAATLAPTAGSNMSSVSIDGSDVYWFQRTTSTRYMPQPMPPLIGGPPVVSSRHQRLPIVDVNGRVLHRTLGSRTVDVVFKPTDGRQIIGFAARAGRVVVGLSDNEEPFRTSIVELIRNGANWTEKEVASRVGGEQGGLCDSGVTLLNVDSSGGIVYSDRSVAGREGKCDLIRVSTAYKRIAPDGVTTDLFSSKSGWAVDTADVETASLRAGPGPWYSRSAEGESFFGAFNVETGEATEALLMASAAGRLEITEDGRVLRQAFTEQKRRFFILNRTPQNFGDRVNFQRSGHTTWFHLCGDKVLEIARKRKPRRQGGGRFWYLFVRNFDAVVERQLPTKFPRGTTFNGCNAETALFSRTVREGRVRQVSVPLGG